MTKCKCNITIRQTHHTYYFHCTHSSALHHHHLTHLALSCSHLPFFIPLAVFPFHCPIPPSPTLCPPPHSPLSLSLNKGVIDAGCQVSLDWRHRNSSCQSHFLHAATHMHKHTRTHIPLIPSYIHVPNPPSLFSPLSLIPHFNLFFIQTGVHTSSPLLFPPLLSHPMLSSLSSWRCFFGDYLRFYWLMGWNIPICLLLPIWGQPCFPAKIHTDTHSCINPGLCAQTYS